MKLPPLAIEVRVEFSADVYVCSPSYPDDARDVWTVWDATHVRQGAQRVASGLAYEEAEALALRLVESHRARKASHA